MQSGLDRGVFKGKHEKEVTGLGIDYLNKWLLTSSLDGTVLQFDFYRLELLKRFRNSIPITNMAYNQENDILAICDTSLTLNLISASTLKRVRHFKHAASNKITDVIFSKPDGRWAAISSMDKCVRVYDILTGSLIDWLKFKQPVLSMDFSNTGELLATSHLGEKGIFLWTNRMYYRDIAI